MWIMLNDAFLSIVSKDCPPDHLLVRARRPGDIEKVFGRRIKVKRETHTDYLYRAAIPCAEVEAALAGEVRRIVYGNFKDSVQDDELHDAYLRVWGALAGLQNPRPYSAGLLNAMPPDEVKARRARAYDNRTEVARVAASQKKGKK